MHLNEANVRARPYYEALLEEAEVLGPAHVEALKAQRARQLAGFLVEKIANA